VNNTYTISPRRLRQQRRRPHAIEKGRLCGGLYLLRLQLVQVIDGVLRVGGGTEDRAVVVLQDLQ
jgi:hypothetical protein